MGNFTLALEHLKEKALHAFSSIPMRKFLNKLNPNTASQILDTKEDFKKWDSSPMGKIHLQFCKRYLEVNNKAANIVCRGELDRLPLLIPINQKIMKYLVYLSNKDNDYIVKQSFLMSKNLQSIQSNLFIKVG